MEVKTGVSSDAVNLRATHTLFVEGEVGSIDPHAVRRLLLDTGIGVKPLGKSYHIKSAAQAMHGEHPNYYFLIDRDHHDETTVENSWKNFPNPSTYNLLIWRKRELENYFLDPDYLSRSRFLKHKPAELKARLLKLSRARVFFDIANQTITEIREFQKSSWIAEFTDPKGFPTSEKAMEQLKNCVQLPKRASDIKEQVQFKSVKTVFGKLQAEFLDGSSKPEFGKGKWLDKMRGKPILKALVSECFEVKDHEGRLLTGSEALTLVAEELLQQDSALQPVDFQELYKLISARVKNSM